ncbi:membrane-associated protein, putative [Bodo saltans]|uniref:Membrane-associated protein, putative n=1 Tax=Bodo saltans TaxID=75058 RepID=A0A0S4IVP5_BODSA|nr:membrane-associated protein, putative [Bodo saltans]|eukprot:CUG05090.1 membrane-associated protein, putative [Bodo saltans]
MSTCVWVIGVVLWLFVYHAVSAKKEKLTFNSYGPAVERRHSCEICRTLVVEAYPIAEELHKNASRRGYALREEEVLSKVTEAICNPFVKAGQWIRLVHIKANEKTLQTVLEPLEFYSQCKRDCTTVANSCSSVVDTDYGDDLPGLLLKLKPVEVIDEAVCKRICIDTTAVRTKPLSAKMIKEIAAEVPVEIDKKNLDIEEIMDDMERARGGYGGAPKMDVFSRDEMMDVQRAILERDGSKLRDLDPSAEDLSDEELEYLQRMYAGEGDGGEEYPTELGEDL